jgi:hypothetical protein
MKPWVTRWLARLSIPIVILVVVPGLMYVFGVFASPEEQAAKEDIYIIGNPIGFNHWSNLSVCNPGTNITRIIMLLETGQVISLKLDSNVSLETGVWYEFVLSRSVVCAEGIYHLKSVRRIE